MIENQFDEHWFVIKTTIRLENFFKKFKSPSHYYRCLSQGNWHLFKKSNRSFFRSFDAGMYRSIIDNEKVSLIFLLRVKNKDKIHLISQELSVRMRKLINSPIKVFGTSELDPTDHKLLNHKKGVRGFKKILVGKEKIPPHY
jgi:hypothetical protein